MIVDTIEELRAELRECVFTPAERKALEVELADSSANATKRSQPSRGHEPPRFASYDAPLLRSAPPLRQSLMAWAGVKVSFLEAAIAIVAPVADCGLRGRGYP